MLESKFQSIVIKALEKMGAVVFNVHGHGMQKAGFPDLLVFHPVWTGGLELKTTAKVSTIQKVIGQRLNAVEFPCYVLRLIEEPSQQVLIQDFSGNTHSAMCVVNVTQLDGKALLTFLQRIYKPGCKCLISPALKLKAGSWHEDGCVLHTEDAPTSRLRGGMKVLNGEGGEATIRCYCGFIFDVDAATTENISNGKAKCPRCGAVDCGGVPAIPGVS